MAAGVAREDPPNLRYFHGKSCSVPRRGAGSSIVGEAPWKAASVSRSQRARALTRRGRVFPAETTGRRFPDVTLVGGPTQEFLVDQDIEQRVAGLAVEAPQLLELLSGQVKAWNFGELSSNDLQPIRHRRLSW